MPDGSSHPFLFKGKGDQPFVDVSLEWGTSNLKGYFNGAAYADLDNDGDLDLIINVLNATSQVLKNNSAKSNSVTLTFKGNSLNQFGLGTKAWLFSKGKIQYQQLMLTRGFQSSVEPRLLFGMNNMYKADSLLIVWPDQRYEIIKNITAGKSLTIDSKNSSGVFAYTSFFPEIQEEFVVAGERISWKHRENEFFDYNVQYLIPHALSTRGPKIAVADVNNDGLDDMYVCGARQQPGVLLIHQQNGEFAFSDTSVFNPDALPEDTDAIFLDVNNDKAPDLLVVSGGNEILQSSKEGEDRLYINDGKGNFSKAVFPFPNQYENKSCIAAADIDKDGDQDFFTGNLANPTAFGQPVHSYLYINNGNGKFDLATAETIFLQSLGMVTSAVFTDINNDTWPDLVVTGEWMGVKIFINKNGKFSASEIPKSTGLWQSLFATDVNGDGYADLLAGNWGLNTKLHSGKNGPCKLYVKDFDNNGAIEQVMCYTIDGKEYTFLAKDELERRMPVLKKAYLTYREVAGKTVQYMFYDLFKNYLELKAEVLASSCFLNDGKGGFTRMNLPDELQLAPVMSFNYLNKKGAYLACGNFFGTIPHEGRYDALLPTGFTFNNNTKTFDVDFRINNISGEMRDSKWIRTINNKRLLVLARNNQSLVFLKEKK
jgi:hypothetical protein